VANFDLFRSGRTLQGKFNSPLNLDFSSMQVQLPAIVSNFSGTHPLFNSKLSASVTGDMLANFSEQNVKLNFRAKIDDSNFTGSLGLQDYAHPAITLDMGVNKLDLDRYLATDWSKRLQDDVLPFDFSGLKDLNLRGKLRSNELKFAKLKVSNLVAEFKAEQSTLLVEPVSARLYGGAALGSFSISANEIPKITFRQKLSGVQLNALLADIIPGEAKLVGKGNLTLDLNATGENMGGLRKNLNGNISIALGQGSLAGINLTEILVAGKSQLGIKDSERSETAKFTESTPFTEFKSTLEISEGNMHNSVFLMKSPLFVSKGEGDLVFESGQLNYHLNTTVASNLKRSSNGELADLKGINIPIRVTGPYASPAVIIDFGAASGGNLAKLLKSSPTNTPIPTPPAAKPVKK
jgi:AsmA protein